MYLHGLHSRRFLIIPVMYHGIEESHLVIYMGNNPENKYIWVIILFYFNLNYPGIEEMKQTIPLASPAKQHVE